MFCVLPVFVGNLFFVKVIQHLESAGLIYKFNWHSFGHIELGETPGRCNCYQALCEGMKEHGKFNKGYNYFNYK